MAEDPLMNALGRIARESESPSDDEAARELLRPFSADELRQMADSAASVALGEPKKPAAVVPAAEARARAKWGMGRTLAIGAFVVAAAAAVVLWARTAPERSNIASYELVVEGSERASRSGEPTSATEPVRVSRDGRLVVIARPATKASGVAASVWIARGDTLTPWSVAPQVSPDGAVRIEAGPNALAQLPEGASQLVVYVSTSGALPGSEAAARDSRRAPPAGVRVLERALSVAPR